ncbi:MAG: sugar phosphate isomerase/epimerase [Clostridia bacterium]|nr:sugar phosphate isomerase/epimerase [Clostridia bacterium]
MQIGVRGHDYGCASAEEMARRISEAGFNCFQLALHKAIEGFAPEYGHLNPGLCKSIRTAFEARKLDVAVLGCYIDPAVRDEEKRLYDVKRFLEQIAYCKQLGSEIVATETSNCTQENRDEQYELLKDSVKRMCRQAECFGVFVGIEPVLKHTLNTPELAARLLSDIASPNLQIVLDPINLLSPENIGNQRRIIDSCFDLFGDRIVAVHAKDVVLENGVFKRCVIGQGLFDHEYFYRKLNKQRPGISVLREEAHPETAHLDLKQLKEYAKL